jgi:hypothetical protein
MQNIMANNGRVFTPSNIRFKQCEALCVGEKVKVRVT